METGQVPRVPVHADSPMAIKAVQIFLKHSEEFSPETKALIEKYGSPLDWPNFNFDVTQDDSKKINGLKSPTIIVSSSGMVTGGRVLHHLAHRLGEARNCVILGGFQAEGTRGRALLEGAKSLNLFGQAVPVLAEIVEMGQFSAHAGKSELLRWLTGFEAPPKQVYLTHGEATAAQSLQQAITRNFRWKAAVARYLDTVEIG